MSFIVPFKFDVNQLAKELDKLIPNLTASARKVGNAIGRGIAYGIGERIVDGVIGTAQSAGQVFAKTFTDSMELTAVNRKFDIVFGTLRGEADKFAKDFATSINGSVTDTKAMMSRFQDTAVPLGFSRSKSFEMAKAMTMLATDLAASEPGITTGDAAARLQSAIVGNHEAVRIFGVGLSEATVKQELFNMGIKGGLEKATEQEKALARLNFIIRSTADAHGAAQRAVGDLRQQMGGLSAVTTETSGRIGMIMAPALAEVISFIKGLVIEINNALGPSEQWGRTLGDAFKMVLANAASVRQTVAELSQGVAHFVKTMANSIYELAGVWNNSDQFYKKLSETLNNASVLIKPFVIELSQSIVKVLGGIGGAIAGALGASAPIITEFIKTLLDELKSVGESLDEYMSNVPGTAAYRNKMGNISARSRLNEDLAIIDNDVANGLATEPEALKRREAAKSRYIRDIEALPKTATQRIAEASQKVGSANMGDTVAKALEGMSKGFVAGSTGVQNSGFFAGLGNLQAAKDAAAAVRGGSGANNFSNAIGGFTKPMGSFVDKAGKFLSIFDEDKPPSERRLAKEFSKLFGDVGIEAIKFDPKSKAEKEALKAITDQEALIKKLKKDGSAVDFTTSESLWGKMQEQFASEDKALKLAQKQLDEMQKARTVAEQTKTSVGSMASKIGFEISRYVGYAP